nr:DUF1015 domain-containing protein [bacterium]
MYTFKTPAIHTANVLLPAPQVDAARWAVIACDQFAADPAYWQQVVDFVGEAPSTLHMVLPEYLLDEEDRIPGRIASIQAYMQRMLVDGTLESPFASGLVYVCRETGAGLREGLMLALDLEQYDYHDASRALIRATEDTLAPRLPIRMLLREGAALEVPGTMVLFDDPEDTVFTMLRAARPRLDTLYNVELMLGGGSLTGYRVEDEGLLARIDDAFLALLQAQGQDAMLFAVGDGNHSLATAKACWEALKPRLTPLEAACHPARYCMVECVNLHGNAVRLEPVHRLITGADAGAVVTALEQQALRRGLKLAACDAAGMLAPGDGWQLITPLGRADVHITQDTAPGTLQLLMHDALAELPGASIRYIHGADTLFRLCGEQPGAVGCLLPPMRKTDLFTAIKTGGTLPPKSFSLGTAGDKRFYMECRRIR